MHFTLAFDSAEDRDVSYGLVFIPCPFWVQGTRQILNLNPENPAYRAGSVAKLVDSEGLRDLFSGSAAHCTVIAHAGGHGTQADLAELLRDLAAEGYSTTVLQLPDRGNS